MQRVTRRILQFLQLLLVLSLPSLATASDSDVITRGILSAITSDTMTVDSVVYQTNGSTEYKDLAGNTTTRGTFAADDTVKAKGQFVSGVLVAEEVELEDEAGGGGGGGDASVEVEGTVTAKTSNSISLQGQTFSVTGGTEIEDSNSSPILFSAIVVGDNVNVRATSGAPTVATRIELKNSDDDSSSGDDLSGPESELEVVGPIDALSSTNITVDGVVYVVNSSTRVEDESSRSILYSVLAVGQIVKVESYLSGSDKIARKIEIEDSDGGEVEVEVTGKIAGLSATQIIVRGLTAILNGSTQYEDANGNPLNRGDFALEQLVKLNAVRAGDGTLTARRVRLRSQGIAGDFDDDGLADKVVYRPDAFSTWFIKYSGTSTVAESQSWGLASDIPLNMDVDGDGRNDLAVFRPSTATWYFRLSSSGFNLVRTVQWGIFGDQPVTGDFDGDKISDIGIYRPWLGRFFILLSGVDNRSLALQGDASAVLERQWGLPTHTPISGMDRDGDGRDDLVVWDTQTGVWYTLYSSSGYNRDGALAGNLSAGDAIQHGLPGDKPKAGDFDGDGKDDITVFRQGTWYFRYSSWGAGATPFAVGWGLPGDDGTVVRSGDDSERRDHLEVYRPSEGNHYERFPTGVAEVTQWGLSTDDPVGDNNGHN